MLLDWFDPYIRKVVLMFAHPLWFIIKNENLTCTCVDPTSKQGKPGCPICFGSGKKITLARVKASNQNSVTKVMGMQMAAGEKNIRNVYYTYDPTNIKVGDYVYDNQCLDIVSDVYYERSKYNQIVYWRIETVPIRNNVETTLNLIRDRLRKAGYDEYE